MYAQATVRERATFINAYREYRYELLRRARFLVGGHELGEDLTQEVFMKTWMYLVRGGKIGDMRAFLHHILTNAVVDVYRKKKTLSLDLLLKTGYEPSEDGSERMIDVLDGKNAFRLINRLAPKYQRVLRLKYADDLPYREISRSTGQSRNTIAVQVHRGLEKLKWLYARAW